MLIITCWLNPVAIALGFPAVPVQAVMILELWKVHVVASQVMPLLSHPYDAIRAAAAYIIVRRNQEVSGQKRCETALEVLFYLNVSENGVCHWRKRGTRFQPKPFGTHGACSNLWVLSHTEMDTLEALANKSQMAPV